MLAFEVLLRYGFVSFCVCVSMGEFSPTILIEINCFNFSSGRRISFYNDSNSTVTDLVEAELGPN